MAAVKVRMISKVSGTRNRASWPEPGGVIEVGEDEAVGLIAGGLAVPYKEDQTWEEAVAMPGDKGVDIAKALGSDMFRRPEPEAETESVAKAEPAKPATRKRKGVK
jgi:hypothetical protein